MTPTLPARRRALLEARITTLCNMVSVEADPGRRARLERDLRATLVDLHSSLPVESVPGALGLARFAC